MLTPHKYNSGLTLLEVLIATSVLVVAITGLLATFIGLGSLDETARSTTLALTAVQDKMEEIRDSDFST